MNAKSDAVASIKEPLPRALELLAEAQGLIESCASFYSAQDQADAAQWSADYEAFAREVREARK